MHLSGNVSVVKAAKVPVEVGHQAERRLDVLGGADEVSVDDAERLEDVEDEERSPARDEQDHDEDQHPDNLWEEQEDLFVELNLSLLLPTAFAKYLTFKH